METNTSRARSRASAFLIFISFLMLTIYSIYLLSEVDKNMAYQIASLVSTAWWYSLIATCGLYIVYSFYNCASTIKQKCYTLIFKNMLKSKQARIILDKNLNIICINKKAMLEIALYQNKIKRQLPDFNINNFQSGYFNFKNLDPKHGNMSSLSILLNSHYSNKYRYGDLNLHFNTKPLKLFGYKIGILVEVDFEKAIKPQPEVIPRSLMQKTPSKHSELENIRLQLINTLLKNKQNKNIQLSLEECLNLYNKVDNLVCHHKKPIFETS